MGPPRNRDRIDCYGLSDPGRVRKVNQDQFLIAELSKAMILRQSTLADREATCLASRRRGSLLAVADGMGGAPAGDRASAVALDGVVRYMLNAMPWYFRPGEHEPELKEELQKMMGKCQSLIEANVLVHPSREGMGTTLTLAYILWPRLWIDHVGDSRCYLYRNSRLHQLTRDHTLGGVFIDRRMPLVVAPGPSPGSEILWNVVGGGTPELSPEVSAFDLKADDVLLLATDGLTRYVPPDEIASALESGGDARETCRRLVIAANQAGGRDNVTVIVGRIANPEGGRADTTGVTARRMSSTDGEPEGQARTVSDRGPLHDDPRPPFNHGVVGRPRSTNRVH